MSRVAMENSVARLQGHGGGVVGTGFLVGADLVCTCAHVVANATGADPRAVEPPAGPVVLDFPVVGAATVTANVVRWLPIRRDETGDVAVLRLNAPVPAGIRAARLSTDGGEWDEAVRVFGFPTDRDAGVWISGRLRGPQATGWVQFQAVDGPRVAAGFSGAPVWSEAAGGVVGMVVAAERTNGTAYLAPIRTLLDEELLDEVTPECPYRGLEAFRERDAAVFFGRRDEARRLADLVAHRELVVVAGRSGSGKSSLVRAALWPRLRETDATIVDFVVPPLAPRELLSSALLPVLGPDWSDRLHHAPARRLGLDIAAEHSRLVLFLDQFEEVAAADPATTRELVALLVDLVSGPRPRPGQPPALQVILTLRSTAVDDVFTAAHAALLDKGTVHMLPLDRENLRAAIEGPARAAGLVRFEPGLVDRIVDDALQAPGQLPLVQFALTLLWEQRRGALLTHDAYAEIGGVTGAIARYADDVYHHRLPTPEDQRLAQQLFLRLARPADDGSFVLAHLPLDGLGAHLVELAGRLNAHRLVVLREDPGRPPTIALAHEALIHQWHTLHDWLVANRDFLVWQASLDARLRAWRSAGRDDGELLRGRALAEAEARRAERPDALTDDEVGYLDASRALARRGVRRWRVVTAVIAVLAVVAAGLAVAASGQSRELADRLRRQAAVALARESMARLDAQWGSSLQFAQAAGVHDPTSPEAEAAILLQHARFADIAEFRTGPWTRMRTAASAADGSVVAVAETGGAVTVWTGLFGGEPAGWPVTTVANLSGLMVSPNGSRLALFRPDGSIEVWDVSRRSAPLHLAPPGPVGKSTTVTAASAEFTPDGGMLAVVHRHGNATGDKSSVDVLTVYDVDRGRQRAARRADDGAGVEVLLMEAGGKAVWLRERDRPGRPWRMVVREVTTGRMLRELPTGWVTGDGMILSCSSLTGLLAGGELTAHDGHTGAVRYRTQVRSCSYGDPLDATRRYLVLTNGFEEDLFQLVTMIDTRTGAAYQVRYPHWRSARSTSVDPDPVRLVIGTEAGPELVDLDGGGLLRTRPGTLREQPGQFRYTGASVHYSVSLDGTLAAAYFDRPEERHAGLEMYALPSQRRVAGGPGTALAELDLVNEPGLAFSPDGRHLLARAANDDLVVLSTADYTVRWRLPIPVPDGMGPEPSQGWPMNLIPQPDGTATVLYAGAFTRWDLSTGERIGAPFPLSDDPDRLRRYARTTASERSGHPGHAFVPVDDGVELWDVDSRSRIAELRPDPGMRLVGGGASLNSPLVALHYANGKVHVWDSGSGRWRDSPGPLPVNRQLIGIGPNDLIVFEAGDEIELWDATIGRTVVAFEPPGSPSSWEVVGRSLLGFSTDGLVTIDLDRESALARLCAIYDQPYSEGQRALLPDGADDDPPCQVARREGWL